MAQDGEMLMAQEYVKLFGLPEAIIDIDPAVLAAEVLLRASKYQQLAIPFEEILFADTVEKAMLAEGWLSNADAIGLDVEWKPDQKGSKSKASILQVRHAEGTSVDAHFGDINSKATMEIGLEYPGKCLTHLLPTEGTN